MFMFEIVQKRYLKTSVLLQYFLTSLFTNLHIILIAISI